MIRTKDLIFITLLLILYSCASSYKEDISRLNKPIFLDFEGRPFSIASADLRNNGSSDIVIAVKYTGIHAILEREGILDFSLPVHLKSISGQMLANPLDLEIADFNKDGISDLAYATEDGVQILINSGDGINYDSSFTLQSPKMSFSLKAVDLNKDGIPDIITGGSLDDRIFFYLSRSILSYELHILKIKSTNELTPFTMQRPFTTVDLEGKGYPSVLIVEFQNSVLWLIENKQGVEFVPYPIYISDFSNKINYAIPLHVDGNSVYIAVAVGTYNPAIEILALDIKTKSTTILQRIPLPAFRDPVHITKIIRDNQREHTYTLLITSLEGLSVVNTDITSFNIIQIYPIKQWSNTIAIMSNYYQKHNYIFTATQKKDGVFVIPYIPTY